VPVPQGVEGTIENLRLSVIPLPFPMARSASGTAMSEAGVVDTLHIPKDQPADVMLIDVAVFHERAEDLRAFLEHGNKRVALPFTWTRARDVATAMWATEAFASDSTAGDWTLTLEDTRARGTATDRYAHELVEWTLAKQWNEE